MRVPKVNFIVIGVQKSGTSALNYYLSRHANISMGKRKELHFFDNEAQFVDSKPDYDYYEQQIEYKKEAIAFGETTPIYIFWPQAIKRIYEYNRKIKLIAILRNPVDRAFSHWNMQVSRGMEIDDFYSCITNESERVGDQLSENFRKFSYLKRGLYAGQIERVLQYFDRQNVLFLKYEQFLKHPVEALGVIFSFLGLNTDDYVFSSATKQSRPYKASMKPLEKEWLVDYFSEDIYKVEKILGWDCTDWLSPNN